jgi:3-hydroxyisobutyrate dehydrogenase-like beta-hydroxyacid dehydrogenase
MPRIAVIAPGAMGAGVAQRLAASGAEVAVTLEGRSAGSAKRAAGLTVLDSETALAAWADLVLSILPPGEAEALAGRLAPVLVPRRAAVAYADCNAVAPGTVKRVAALLPGVRFVDVGIIGGPPKEDGAGPRFYASGDTACLDPAAAYGIDVRPIERGVGAASALKMSYAGITKGLIAIGSSMIMAAERAGVADALRAELGAVMALGAARADAAAALHAELASSQKQLLAWLDRSEPMMFSKAYRWVAEMEEIEAFLAGIPGAAIYGGAARLYEHVARDADAVAALADFYKRD